MIEIELSKTGKNRGLYKALIDEGYEKVLEHNWSVVKAPKHIYAHRKDNFKTVQLHREIMSIYLGRKLLSTELVDHIDGNGLNCRISNLRLTDKAGNGANRPHNDNSKSKVKGVHWREDASKWRAVIKVSGKNIHLGYFTKLEDAEKAYKQASKKYQGDYAHEA